MGSPAAGAFCPPGISERRLRFALKGSIRKELPGNSPAAVISAGRRRQTPCRNCRTPQCRPTATTLLRHLGLGIFVALFFGLAVFFWLPAPGSGSARAAQAAVGRIRVPLGNMRTRPDFQAPVAHQLNPSDGVRILLQKGPWVAVRRSDDTVGWIHQSILVLEDSGNDPGVASASPADGKTQGPAAVSLQVPQGRIRARPALDAPVNRGVQSGDRATVLATAGDWLLVSLADDFLGWAHRSLFAENTTPASPPAPPEISPELRALEYIMTAEGDEMVSFRLNGHYPPTIYADTGTAPRVVCDFVDVRLGPDVQRLLRTEGPLIRQVRIGIHKGAQNKLRVILDLVPGQDYDIRPFFFKKENLFTLLVVRTG